MAEIVAVCGSEKKGMRKKDRGRANLIVEFGMENDAHAAYGNHRQVSLLALESIEKMQAKGLNVGCGDFAENITTKGIELYTLPLGARLRLGQEAIGEISQIGKECHNHCAIYIQAGDCVMPREGIFIRVLKGGEIKNGDEIKVEDILTAGILTVSDKGSKGERPDESGPLLKALLKEAGFEVLEEKIVSDDKEEIKKALINWADIRPLDLILTSGGTGFSPRDNTPEATLEAAEKLVPGLCEAMRYKSLEKTPHAMLSRSVAGIRKKSLLINLPGSPRAAKENLEVILPALNHGLKIIQGKTGECARPL